jgi:hypothetical protein
MKDEKVLTLEELKEKYKTLGEEIAQKELAEAKAREAKLAAEKEARYKEIEEAADHLDALIRGWTADYGSFTLRKTYKDRYSTPSLWHLFF